MIASLQALLSKAISLEIFQSLRSLLTDSSQVSLGLPLPLFTLSTRSRTPQRTGASGGLRWTCPNHLSRCWVSFSSIGATPTLSRIASFRTLSLLVCPQNHRNIRISATLSCWTCRLFVGQYSAPYNKDFSLAYFCFMMWTVPSNTSKWLCCLFLRGYSSKLPLTGNVFFAQFHFKMDV